MIEQNLILGILAHVDAGKTTLSEALLHITGAVRRAGRVDHGDAFLDTDDMEKERGITIFSKQARFTSDRGERTLRDTSISPRRWSACWESWTAQCWSSARRTE